MVKGFIVSPDYVNVDNETFIQLFGRLENGESFAILKKFIPYLFIKKSDKHAAEKLLKNSEVKLSETDFTNFKKDAIVKIEFENQEHLNKISKELHEAEINTFEADLKPHVRFAIDNDLYGSINIEGDYESSERVSRVYRNPEITPCKSQVELKVASVDIESGKKDGELYCIGIYSKDFRKNFMITNKKVEGVIACKDEEDCLTKFKEALIELDPDIITGWNVIDFDFKFLKNLFEKKHILFDLGRTNSNARLRLEANFFKSSSMNIPGRVVLDGLNFIKDPFIQEAPSIKNTNFESYTLGEVSSAILGKTKLINGKNRHEEIDQLFKKNPVKLAEYNLMDCQLVYEILEKTNMIELSMERSELTGLPIDRITGSIAAFDSVYIREARKRGLVSPSNRFGNKEERIKGGFVMSPKPGIYHNIVVLDFKSLYPSIIRTFNIDPASFISKKEKGCIESPNGAFFINQEGILPMIIERLHQAREKAKKEKRELSSYAIKIIQNSFFGVLASPLSRYFDLKMGNAITNFGQEIIKLTAKEIEKMGYAVTYGDTDSVFIKTGLDKDKSLKAGQEISQKINSFYQDYVSKKFNRKSYLDLEFDKLYLALIMPGIKMKQKKSEEGEEAKGAKKRYAGLIEEDGKEELEVVGMEAIRGDWTEAAREFQKKLFLKIFHKEDPIPFIKEYVKELSSGKLDKQLVYRKSIRKDLKEYTKTTPPHVKAARKLESLESNVIEYFITTDGPEPIQQLKHKLDYEHYVDKQIKPIADQVLVLFGKNFEDIIKGTKQQTLF
ncbi:DNA polymerase II [Candidatus Pacearchaeota archaeon]|nr:DNA polymerase II [Candidatus Pacearchaeota archaeon]